MSDLIQWDPVDDNNNDSPPDGFPEGMNYSQVNNASRAVMGAMARYNADHNGSLTTGGTGNAYTVTSNQTIAAYTAGISLVILANRVNTDTPTLNLNGLGALPFRREAGVDLEENEIANTYYRVLCDGTQFLIAGAASAVAEVHLSDLVPLGPGGATRLRLIHTLGDDGEDRTHEAGDLLDLVAKLSTPETVIEGSDLITFYDDSDGVIKTVARQVLFDLFSDLTTPLTDFAVGDFLALGDATDSNKIKLISLANYYKNIETTLPLNSRLVFFDPTADQVKTISSQDFQDNVIGTTADTSEKTFSVGGVLVKVGNVVNNTDSAQVYNFGTAFPNVCWGVWINKRSSNSTNPLFATDITAVKFEINRSDFDDGTSNVDYFAIGF